ncbi:MAG: hypothetical protein IIZ33_00025, partial [Erysipelotrichaceae bacterium]|nr:hypothetical protein [Erysipelotrichaceae bacterium]
MKKKCLSFLVLLLSLFMLVGVFPVRMTAEDNENTDVTDVSTEVLEEEQQEGEPAEEVETSEETEVSEEEIPVVEEQEETPEEELPADDEEVSRVEGPAEGVELPEILVEQEELTLASSDPTRDIPQGTSVSVSASKVTVTLNQVALEGTVQLYRMAANEYFEGDPYTGMSEEKGVKGTYLGTYLCNQLNEVTFNRYRNTGEDNLYCKYYLVRGGAIFGGPYYATSVDSMRSAPLYPAKTKKGIIHEMNETYALMEEFGGANTVVNMDLASLIYRNEDDEGNPVDNSARSNVIAFESNGEMFYFNAGYIQEIDSIVSTYSKMGVNVTFVVIAWGRSEDFTTYPRSLAYVSEVTWTLAFNTSNERGLRYFTACMEFLAERYSRGSSLGTVDKFIIGNEIDYTYDWCLLEPSRYTDANGVTHYTRVDFDVFMEEYARGLRIADLAVKKYNSEARVYTTFTHNWADARWETYIDENGQPYIGDTIRVYNSYAPKKCLDWLNSVDKARGDYDWGASFHPYPIGTSSNIPNYTDLHTDEYYSNIHSTHEGLETVKKVTGNWRTTPWVTCVNLEIYQQYFTQAANRYNGKEVRDVILTEASVCSSNSAGQFLPDAVEAIIYHSATNEYENKVSGERYPASYMKTLLLYRQAASIAAYYYRAAQVPCISDIAYFQPHDQDAEVTNKLGLMEVDGTKKPAYDVWKYVDTNLSYAYTNKYLKYLNMYYPEGEKKNSYYELMDLTNSGYWSGISEDTFNKNALVRTVESTGEQRSLVTDKQNYSADDPIFVTATGETGDIISLYKKGENYDAVEPIFSYSIGEVIGSITARSGKTLNILAYGQISMTREADATLRTGDYVILLERTDGEEPLSVDIHISGRYSIGTTNPVLKTDKDVYNIREDIIVTAGGGTDYWVGLYGKDDVTVGADGYVQLQANGDLMRKNITTIYWYYVNESPYIPGKPTVLQTTTHNGDSSNPSNTIAGGEYYLVLFDNRQYHVAKGSDNKPICKKITVVGDLDVPPLKSITYELEDPTDGFANGVVTIT